MQIDTFQDTVYNFKWNSKRCSSKPQENRKRKGKGKQRNKENKQKTKIKWQT